MIRSLALVLCLAALGQEGRAQRSRPVNPGGLARAVAKYPITFGLESPAGLLGMLLGCLGPRLQREEIVSAMQIIDEELMQEAGFALSKPATWLQTGIHPTGAVRVSVLGFGTWGFPDPGLFSVGTRQPEVLRKFLGERMGEEWQLGEGRPAVYLGNGGYTALGFLGGRMHLLGTTDRESAAEVLRGTLGDMGRARTIAADPAYELVKGLKPKSLPLALFVNFAAIEQLSDNSEFGLPDSLLVALGPEGLFAGAPLAEDSVLLALEPGADSEKFLVRFDQPTFAFSVSLSDPMQGLRAVVAELMPVGLLDFDQAFARLPDRLGMDADSFARQLTNGSGGLLIYPGAEGQSLPDIVVYLHLQDPAAMRKQFAPGVPHEGYDFELHLEGEGQYLVRAPDGNGEIILGVVDDFLLISNSRKHVDRMAKGEASAWQPRIGGRQLFAAELNPEGIAEILTQSRMDELIPFVDKFRLFAQLEIKPQGLLARVEPFGDRPGRDMVGDFLEACLLAFAREIGPREPEFKFKPFTPEQPKEKKKD